MKVILPVTNNDTAKSSIASSFHNTEYVCIYDLIGRTYEYVAAKNFSSSNDLSTEFKRNGIGTIISNQMAPMALKLFAENGFNVYKAQSEGIEENIGFLINNQLELMNFQLAKSMSDCSSSCGTCSSSTCK
jgi:predicted Fe-Mo cluster-binding NifX family protein